MNFNAFYPVMRTILGDRQVHEQWNYPDGILCSALASVFALGRGPDGYSAVGATVVPDPPSGDDFALIVYDAVLLMIGGEDGAMQYRTRALWVRDFGERKRDLLSEMHILTYQIRDGKAVFSTIQSFTAFTMNLPAGGGGVEGSIFEEFTNIDLETGVSDITV